MNPGPEGGFILGGPPFLRAVAAIIMTIMPATAMATQMPMAFRLIPGACCTASGEAVATSPGVGKGVALTKVRTVAVGLGVALLVDVDEDDDEPLVVFGVGVGAGQLQLDSLGQSGFRQ